MLKKFKIFNIAALLVAFLIFLSGCSFSIISVEKLVRPPYASDEMKEVQEKFYDFVGNSVTLLTPANGDYRTSFIMYDIDGEKGEEALVFYVGNDSTSHLHILKKVKDRWINAGDFVGYGNSLDFVNFVDMNSDAIPEILVGWSRLNSTALGKYFSVYSCDTLSTSFKIRSLISENYTLITTADIDNDKNTDILVTMLDTSQSVTRAYARMFSYQEGYDENQNGPMITLVTEVQLDGNITSYYKMYTESTQTENIVYVDAYKGDSQMITEVLTCKKNASTSDGGAAVDKYALEAPLLDKSTLTMNATWRGVNMPSRDIDTDGFIEIPVQTPVDASTVPVNQSLIKLELTDWVRYRNGELQTVKSCFVSPKGDYYLYIDDSIKSQVKAQYSRADKKLKIYTGYDSWQTELATIYEFSATDWNVLNEQGENEYLFLRENQKLGTVYACTFTLYGQDDFGISAEYIDKNFVINS